MPAWLSFILASYSVGLGRTQGTQYKKKGLSTQSTSVPLKDFTLWTFQKAAWRMLVKPLLCSRQKASLVLPRKVLSASWANYSENCWRGCWKRLFHFLYSIQVSTRVLCVAVTWRYCLDTGSIEVGKAEKVHIWGRGNSKCQRRPGCVRRTEGPCGWTLVNLVEGPVQVVRQEEKFEAAWEGQQQVYIHPNMFPHDFL